jgi:hypothetical protein
MAASTASKGTDIGDERGDALGEHQAVQSVAGVVGSEAGDERGVRTGSSGGHRLVEPFASGVFGVLGSENSFAGRG